MDFSDLVVNVTRMTHDGNIPLSRQWEIVSIAPGSPAEAAGLIPGYILVSREDAHDADSIIERFIFQPQVLWFHDPFEGDRVNLHVRAYPFGMRLRRPIVQLVEDVARGVGNDGALAEALLAMPQADFQAVARHLADRRGKAKLPASTAMRAMFSPKRFKQIKAQMRDFADIVGGVLAAQEGRIDDAVAALAAHTRDDPSRWTTPVTAIWMLGEALVAEQQGEPADAVVERLRDAMVLAPESTLISHAYLLRAGGDPLTNLCQRFAGERFPMNWRLARHDPTTPLPPMGAPFVSLEEWLGGLGRDEVGAICLLGHYRSNGPFSDALLAFALYRQIFSAPIGRVAVLTGFNPQEDKPPHAHWMEGENRLAATGLEVEVFHDPDLAVHRALDPSHSPTIYLVDRSGLVLTDECGSAVEFTIWEAIQSTTRAGST